MDSKHMAPIYLSPGSRKIVVFGGGKVALRKIRHFRDFRIKVVSEEILPEIEDLVDEKEIARVDDGAVKENISGTFIIVAATNDKSINDTIRNVAMEYGVLVNSAHGGGDVLIPSVLERKNYSIAVSTEGKVPAFPPYVIGKLDKVMDEKFDLMMDLLIELRPLLREKVSVQTERAKILSDILDNEQIWHMLDSGDTDGALSLAKKIGGLR